MTGTHIHDKTNTQIAKITPNLDKLLEYKRNWIQHVNRMPRNRLPRIMKPNSATGRRNHDRPLKRLLDTWDRNGWTTGPTPWQIHNDDDDKRLSLGLTDCHSKRFVDRKLSSAPFECNSRIRWTQLNPGYKESYSRIKTSALLQCLCNHITITCFQQRRPREANVFMNLLLLPVKAKLPIFNIQFFVVNNSFF